MSAGPRLQHQIINTTYDDLSHLVFQVTHGFARQYNIPFQELVSEAHMIYVEQVPRYDRTKGTALSSWIYTKVWFGLMSYVRNGFQRPPHVELEEAPEVSTPPEQFLLDFRDELSEDARTVVGLLLDSRRDFSLLCKWNRVRTRKQMLKTLREQLRDEGWSSRKIFVAFFEIREALSA